MTSQSHKKGFSLIELLVVISITGLLSSIVFVSVEGVRARARDSRRVSDLIQMKLALEFYNDSNNALPENVNTQNGVNFLFTSSGKASNLDTCTDLGTASSWSIDADIRDLVTDGYIGRLPVDPRNENQFCYRYQANPDARGACMWTLLENHEKVGIIVGEPSPLVDLNQYYPKGFTCGEVTVEGRGLDRIVGGEIGGIGNPGDTPPPIVTPTPTATQSPVQTPTR